jgi:hypothetical protein
MDAFQSSLERSPELFPLTLDLLTDTVTLIRLTRRDYEAESFLDERILRPYTLSRPAPFAQLAAAVSAGTLAERCHFIFHIGHVGSTLLSRLLGEDKSLFALREPAILRTAAQMRSAPERQPRVWNENEFEARLSVFLRLWSRTFASGETAVIKATSFVSDLAAELMARPTQPGALLVFVGPESYIATIMAGANAREEAVRLAPQRGKRLARHLGEPMAVASEGEAIALAWAVEMCGLVAAMRAGGPRALPLEFDRFLAAPEDFLLAAFRHFGSAVTPERVSEILAGPHMRSYSKAPEHAYSPALRREALDEARQAHAAEIGRGLAWIDRAAGVHPLVRECLALA